MMMGFGNRPDEVTAPRGFTLAELMVTLALVAILAAIAAPSVRGYMRQADGRSAASAMANQFRKARDSAMSRGEVVFAKVLKDGGDQSRGLVELYRTDNSETSCISADTGDTTLLESEHVAHHSNEVTIRGASNWNGSGSGEAWICFSPTGEVLTPSGTEFTTPNCGHAWRFWMSGQKMSTLSNSIDETACTLSGQDRIKQRDARYKINMWVIDVPYNGGVSVNQ